MSINAVKGVEIGNGFNCVNETGISNVDEMRIKSGKPYFLSNNNGGILGGISSGQEIICRFVVKPTSSILSSKKTIDIDHYVGRELIKNNLKPIMKNNTPYILFKQDEFEIVNLHIHSKKLESFVN